jgi:hypothetical protein
MKSVFLTILFFLLFAISIPSPALSGQREALLQRCRAEPAKNIVNYNSIPDGVLIHKIQKAPDFLIKYLSAMDKTDNYLPYLPSKEEQALIGKYLKQLPPQFIKCVRERLIGFYFIENFKGAGMTDWVLGPGNEMYFIMILNPETLKTSASKWLSYKDSSCFIFDDPSVQIEIDCGPDLREFPEILIHETSHLADYVIGFTPFVEPSIGIIEGERPNKNRFVEDIWKEIFIPEKKYDFPGRDNLHFYGLKPAALSITNAERIYSDLSATPFVSLYASTSWAEDFACLVSFYYITHILQKTYIIRVMKDKKTVFSWSPADSGLISHRLSLIKPIFGDR